MTIFTPKTTPLNNPYDKYLKKLRSVIGKDQLDIHNQESGWQTRNRKLQLDDFLNLFVNRRPQTHLSLNEMSQEILNKEVSISKEGINKRINAKSVTLLKGILNDVVALNLSPLNAVKTCFSSIVITDATSFQLPCSLNDSYKGFGGNHGVRGGVKVQYQLSLTNGITKTEIVSATRSDQKTKIIAPKKDELHLFDLGYFSLERLNEINKKQAYYLCRLKINTILRVKYGDQWVIFDWKNMPAMKTGETKEYEACLGANHDLSTRLFMTKIDRKSEQEKRRKLIRNSKRHGKSQQ